jgi:patatin-like phospholipase/acyl hydrolase
MLSSKPAFRILALDGGGIRGIIPASALIALQKRLPIPLVQIFDLVVGTSTGGLIALGLTQPGTGGLPKYNVAEILKFYTDRDNDKQIFTPWIGESTGGPPVGWEWALLNPKYTGSGMNHFLTRHFGSSTLADAITPVSCVSYQISDAPAPYFFRSWTADQPGQNFSAVHVGRATSAAPLYFPPVKITSTDNTFTATFADGGIAANDPAIVAFAEADQLLASQGKNIADYNVWILSIGTGQASFTVDPGDSGIYGWLRNDALPNALLNGPEQVTDTIARLLFQESDGVLYQRVQVPLQGTAPGGRKYSCASDLDDWTHHNVEQLLLAGEAAGAQLVALGTVKALATQTEA